MNESLTDKRLLIAAAVFSAACWLIPFFVFYGQWIWLEFDVGRELATLQVLKDGGRLYSDVISWYGPVVYLVAGTFVKRAPFSLVLSTHIFQLLMAAACSAGIYFAAKRLRVPVWISLLLPGVYGAISAINPDGTSFLLPYSLAATGGVTLLVWFFVALHRAFERRDLLSVIIAGINAAFLAGSKQDFLMALGLAFLLVLLLRIYLRKPVISNSYDFLLLGIVVVTFMLIIGFSVQFNFKILRENLLPVEMIQAFYPNGGFYEFARGYSPRMQAYFFAGGLLMAGFRWIPDRPTLLTYFGTVVIAGFLVFGNQIKPVFYSAPFVYLLFRVILGFRDRRLPEVDPILIFTFVLVFTHTRQGTMNELYQAGGLLIWAHCVFSDGFAGSLKPRNSAAAVVFLILLAVFRVATTGERLNQGVETSALHTPAGTFHLKPAFAAATNEILPEIQRRSSLGVAFGQEAGWLSVASGVPSKVRDYQWWSFNEDRILENLNASHPGSIVLVYFDGRRELRFFSGCDSLAAYVREFYQKSVFVSKDGFTIEIWDKLNPPIP